MVVVYEYFIHGNKNRESLKLFGPKIQGKVALFNVRKKMFKKYYKKKDQFVINGMLSYINFHLIWFYITLDMILDKFLTRVLEKSSAFV